ncbi:MAG: hypothetical protein Q8Q89_01720 [bacterium]|nr:hypothetical protein [bacterium]
MDKMEQVVIFLVILVVASYFLLATPVMMDDGFHYEGFTEALAQGRLDFQSFYGFQGLSILSVPIFWLTGSHISIIIASAILYLLSLLLAYLIGKNFYNDRRAGVYFMTLILLMPYVYTTMMRGFQEAALLFFILLTIWGALNKKLWTPVVWAFGGIVKPFALVLFPLFVKDFLPKSLVRSDLTRVTWVLTALAMGAVYLGISYYQTGHLVNNAAINSYQGNFDVGNPPPLIESFTIGAKGFLRIGANLLLPYRKILLSPLAVVLGGLALLKFKELRLRREIILAILLNVFLVGGLTFSFSKYLLPMVVLLALTSVSYLLKYKWLIFLVLADSVFVFMPIWNYFGRSFWDNAIVYYMPLYLSVFIIVRTYAFGQVRDKIKD